MSNAAIRALLEKSNDYPRNVGTLQETNGFALTRDELIAILQECSPRVVVGATVDHYEQSGDGTSFRLTVYATFSRSELGMPSRLDNTPTEE